MASEELQLMHVEYKEARTADYIKMASAKAEQLINASLTR